MTFHDFQLAGCGKTRCTHTTPLKYDRWSDDSNNLKMLKKAIQQGRSEPLSEARTMLAAFFSILLGESAGVNMDKTSHVVQN